MVANKTMKITVLIVIMMVIALGAAIFGIKIYTEDKVRQILAGISEDRSPQGVSVKIRLKNIGNISTSNLLATEILVDNVEFESNPAALAIKIPQMKITRSLTSFSDINIMIAGPITLNRNVNPQTPNAPSMDIVLSTPVSYAIKTREVSPSWLGDVDVTMPGEIKLVTAGIDLFKVTFAPGSIAKSSYMTDGSQKGSVKFTDIGFSLPMAKIEGRINSIISDGESQIMDGEIKIKGNVALSGYRIDIPTLPPLKDFMEKNNMALEFNGGMNFDFKNSDKNNGEPIITMIEFNQSKLSLGNYFIGVTGKLVSTLKEDQTPSYTGQSSIKINNLQPLIEELKTAGLAPETEAEAAKISIANLNAMVSADADGNYPFDIKIVEGDKITVNGLNPGEFMARLSSGNVTATVPESAVSPTPDAAASTEKKPAHTEEVKTAPTAPATVPTTPTNTPASAEPAPASATPAATTTPPASAPTPTEPKPAQAETAPSQPTAAPASTSPTPPVPPAQP